MIMLKMAAGAEYAAVQGLPPHLSSGILQIQNVLALLGKRNKESTWESPI
jgi:hypothetical protein